MPQIIMKSEEFGEETFDYDTIPEAQEGFQRLKESVDKHTAEDGIPRTLLLVLEEYTSDGEEADDEPECPECNLAVPPDATLCPGCGADLSYP